MLTETQFEGILIALDKLETAVGYARWRLPCDSTFEIEDTIRELEVLIDKISRYASGAGE